MDTWVVVADSGRARIFGTIEKLTELEEVQDFLHAGSRDNTTGDPRGRGGSGHGSGVHHGLEAPLSIKEHDAAAFARELATFLRGSFNEQLFNSLVLIAAPDFLGELRKAMDSNVLAVVTQSVNKDFTHYGIEELEEYFRKT